MTEDGKWIEILRSWSTLIVSTLVLVVGVSVVQHYKGIHDYMLLNWIVLPCFVVMLFPLGSLRMPRLEKSKVLNYASQISYAFFLAQYFAWSTGKWFVDAIGYNHNWLRILFTFTLCLLISVGMYEVVQKRGVGYVRRKLR